MLSGRFFGRWWIRLILNAGFQNLGGVKVNEIVDTADQFRQVHDPGNPEANEDGFIWLSNVNEVTEMVEMVVASLIPEQR